MPARQGLVYQPFTLRRQSPKRFSRSSAAWLTFLWQCIASPPEGRTCGNMTAGANAGGHRQVEDPVNTAIPAPLRNDAACVAQAEAVEAQAEGCEFLAPFFELPDRTLPFSSAGRDVRVVGSAARPRRQK